MQEISVDISELKNEGGDLIEELAKFLEESTKAEVETATDEITVKSEGEKVSRSYLRVLLRKFLHKQELKEDFRVIGGRENTWIIKERKIFKEE